MWPVLGPYVLQKPWNGLHNSQVLGRSIGPPFQFGIFLRQLDKLVPGFIFHAHHSSGGYHSFTCQFSSAEKRLDVEIFIELGDGTSLGTAAPT